MTFFRLCASFVIPGFWTKKNICTGSHTSFYLITGKHCMFERVRARKTEKGVAVFMRAYGMSLVWHVAG
jgi:hypothetical protein